MTDETSEDAPITGDFSVLARMDFALTDPQQLINSARRLAAEEDPPPVIETVNDAVLATVSIAGFESLLDETPGVEVKMVLVELAEDLEPLQVAEEEQ